MTSLAMLYTPFPESTSTIQDPQEKSDRNKLQSGPDAIADDQTNRDFVFIKAFQLDPPDAFRVQEAKGLDAITTAIENLEDQLDFFHTIQAQQLAERDAAIARFEQSRIVLALKLSEHHGKKYKVIEEALPFVRDVHDSARLVSSENLCGQPCDPSSENLVTDKGNRSNKLVKVLFASLNFAMKSLRLYHLGGTSIATSVRKASLSESSSSDIRSSNLDALLARGSRLLLEFNSTIFSCNYHYNLEEWFISCADNCCIHAIAADTYTCWAFLQERRLEKTNYYYRREMAGDILILMKSIFHLS